jgi:serine/threonine protein kinase
MVNLFGLNKINSIIMEYADGGNLLEYVEYLKETNTMMSEREALLIFLQIMDSILLIQTKYLKK